MIHPRNSEIRRSRARLLAAVMFLCVSGGGWAARYTATPDTYVAAVTKLAPGDTLKLVPGIYRRGLRLQNMHGTPSKPIMRYFRKRHCKEAQSRNITACFNAAKDHLVYPNGPLGRLDFYPIRGKLRSKPIDWRELAEYPR